jgi:carbohydrate-selective porin OprB
MEALMHAKTVLVIVILMLVLAPLLSHADGDLDDQGALDAFYRVEVTPQIAVSPTLQLIINPVLNPDKDAVWVLGIRSRFTF